MSYFSSHAAWLRLLPILLAVPNAQTDPNVTCAKPTDPRGIAVHESGALYVLDPGQGVMHEFDAVEGQYIGTVTTETGIAAGGLQVVGDYLLVCPASETNGTMEVISLKNGTVVNTFSGEEEVVTPGGYDVAVDANGTVYVSNYVDVGVKVYNGTTTEYLGSVIEDTQVMGLAFGPDDILYATVPEVDEVRRFAR